jgi:hypothetical protein
MIIFLRLSFVIIFTFILFVIYTFIAGKYRESEKNTTVTVKLPVSTIQNTTVFYINDVPIHCLMQVQEFLDMGYSLYSSNENLQSDTYIDGLTYLPDNALLLKKDDELDLLVYIINLDTEQQLVTDCYVYYYGLTPLSYSSHEFDPYSQHITFFDSVKFGDSLNTINTQFGDYLSNSTEMTLMEGQASTYNYRKDPINYSLNVHNELGLYEFYVNVEKRSLIDGGFTKEYIQIR